MTEKTYDLIGFGDEVPGVLALVAAARAYRKRTGGYVPRSLLMLKRSASEGIGGHLVRGGLAYLDRSQVTRDQMDRFGLGRFGDPPPIYQEFLDRSGVTAIALDRRRADATLQAMMREAQISRLSTVRLQQVEKSGDRLAAVQVQNGDWYRAKIFVDSTVNGELAQAAGARKLQGWETLGLPDAALPATLVFETEGLSAERLAEIERGYLKRLLNPADAKAQHYLNLAAGGDAALADALRQRLRDANGNPNTLYIGPDYIDGRSPALSIFYHASRGTKLSLTESGAVLDTPNIARLSGDRLSWNSLLVHLSGAEAEALANGGGYPHQRALQEMEIVSKWLRNGLGARTVTPMRELYIRYAGCIADPVRPLSGQQMLAGGLPADEGIGTFSYHFDVRGGIEGLGERARSLGWTDSLHFDRPTYNYGIGHAIPRSVPNLAIVSPASGYKGYAPSAGRIVEGNVGVAQGIGMAAAIALQTGGTLADVPETAVRAALQGAGWLPKRYGQWLPDTRRMAAFEETLVPPGLWP